MAELMIVVVLVALLVAAVFTFRRPERPLSLDEAQSPAGLVAVRSLFSSGVGRFSGR